MYKPLGQEGTMHIKNLNDVKNITPDTLRVTWEPQYVSLVKELGLTLESAVLRLAIIKQMTGNVNATIVAEDDHTFVKESDKCLEPVTVGGWYETEQGNFRKFTWRGGQLDEDQTVTPAQLHKIREQEQEWLRNPPADM
jgi:hypothetical protein